MEPMDGMDLTERFSVLDENNKVTLIVGDEEEHLDKVKAKGLRDWLEQWLHHPSY